MPKIIPAIVLFIACLFVVPPIVAVAHRKPVSAVGSSKGYSVPGTTLVSYKGKGKLKVVLRGRDWKWLGKRGKLVLRDVARSSLQGLTRKGSKFRRQLKSRSLHVEVGVKDRSSGPDGERVEVSVLILRKNDAKILASLSGAASFQGGSRARAQGKAAAFALQSALGQLGDVVSVLD